MYSLTLQTQAKLVHRLYEQLFLLKKNLSRKNCRSYARAMIIVKETCQGLKLAGINGALIPSCRAENAGP